MDDFLDRHQVPKLNQDQIYHINSPITAKEIGVGIKNPGPDGFSAEFYQNFKDYLVPILTPQTIP